jgi:ligand-binding sensor domain-containing protein/PAS domain-containing protein
MIKFLRPILFLLCFCFNTLSFAEKSDEKNILLQRLTVKDGLSQGTINDIFQDEEGFLWFATENGVNLYDGYRFRVLPGLTDSFTDNGVYKIIQDKQSILWMIASSGLFSYNKKTNEYQHILKHAPEHKDYYLVDVIADEDSTLWIASSKTLLKYVQSTQEYETVVDLSKELSINERIYQLEKHGHYLYLATRAGIYLVDTNDGQWKKLPSINKDKLIKNSKLDKIYNIYISNDNQLYMGTFEGLYKLDINNIESFFTSDSLINHYELLDVNLGSYSFYPSKDSLYIGSALGLSKINFSNDKIEHLFAYNDVYDSINNNIINAMLIDSQGMFWLGSDTTGIYKWDPELSMVNTIRYKKSNPNRLSDNVIWALELSKADPNILWIGTQNGLNKFDLKTNKVERFLVNTNRNEIYSESVIYSLKEDKYHRLWLFTEKGIKLFDTQTNQKMPLPFSDETNQFLSSEVYAIYLDENDFLWVLTDKKFRRINIITGEIDELIELESNKPELSGIHGFLPDSQNMLISSNKSFFSFNVVTREINILYQDQSQGDLDNEFAYFDSWLIDKNNILWLASATKGLVGLDATTYETKYFINRSNSQIDHNVYGLMQDNEGELWFSSHNGIYSLDLKTNHLRNYNVDDGLSAREFNSGAFAKINDSILAYGSVNGLNMFNPSDFKKKKFEGDLVVHATNIDVLSREVKLPFILNPKEKIQLNYDDVGIRFDFSALTFRQDDLVYRYELSGGRNITYPETTNNFITFANLPSGDNTLTVQVRSSETGEYSEKTKVSIYVDYAPWASPMAYILYFVFILTVFIVWLERKKKITQQLVEAHEQVKYREQRLSLALHGSNIAVWDWQAKDNLMFGYRASQELGFSSLEGSYSFDHHIELIHENDREAFVHQWRTFIENADLEDNFSCSYRLRNSDGEWIWYKDLGKIVEVNVQGKPLRVTGSYTNINESRAASERAQYYGDAFKQTQDWVLIISDNFTRVMVNNSLKDAFSWQEEEFSFNSEIFGFDIKKRAFYKKLLMSLKEREHWRG